MHHPATGCQRAILHPTERATKPFNCKPNPGVATSHTVKKYNAGTRPAKVYLAKKRHR
jgi:hypothetical protein